MTTIWSNSTDYYNLIDTPSKSVCVVVFGVKDEQWTQEVIHTITSIGLHVHLFPWEQVVDLRLQLEVACYPYIQVWKRGTLKLEIFGYQNEEITTQLTTLR